MPVAHILLFLSSKKVMAQRESSSGIKSTLTRALHNAHAHTYNNRYAMKNFEREHEHVRARCMLAGVFFLFFLHCVELLL